MGCFTLPILPNVEYSSHFFAHFLLSGTGLALGTSSNSLPSRNLSTCWECWIVDMSRISKKTVKNEKKVACYHLENELSTFSALDVSSNEFSTCQINTSMLIYTRHCQPFSGGVHAIVFTKQTVTRDILNIQTSVGACWKDNQLQNACTL